MGWKHYQTVDHPKRKPQVGSGPVWYPCNNSSFQISIFQIHQIVNISYFPQFNLSFEKKISFQKCPEITQKFTQNCLTVVNVMSRDLALLETRPRYWQRGRVQPRQNSLHVHPRLKQEGNWNDCCHWHQEHRFL